MTKRRFSPLSGLATALVFAACATRPPAAILAPAAEAAKDVALRFAVYGDTREHHDIHQDIVDKVLRFSPALVLQTGDLVHNGDVIGEWAKFDEITAQLRSHVPYYPARGNHDVSSHHYYEDRVTQPTLSGNHLYYSFESGVAHFVSIDTEQSVEPQSPQASWLAADLDDARSRGRFIVPFLHKAIFSIGPHSTQADVLALRPILHSLFRQYGVTLAFQGHDHLYYRTQRDGIAT